MFKVQGSKQRKEPVFTFHCTILCHSAHKQHHPHLCGHQIPEEIKNKRIREQMKEKPARHPQAVRQTHHKAKPILQVDFPDASVSLEEFLHVPLPGVWAQVADEDTTTTHC